MKQSKVATIVLNWNGEEDSLACIDMLKEQTVTHEIIAVDNGSKDTFADLIGKKTDVILLKNHKNLGFSGGVNTGIRYAIREKFNYVALINNDAKPEKTWLEELIKATEENDVGIATGKLLKTDGLIDSTGDQYTTWGLPYPRGRNEKDTGQYKKSEEVFAASGGASLYKVKMLEEIGLFDEDFFAYYEDVDLSFRAQLAGWKVVYTPKAIAHHKVGASSSKIPGFTTYMTIKNLPWLFWKNVPLRLVPRMLPRFTIAYSAIIISSISKNKVLPVVKGLLASSSLMIKKLLERHKIQASRRVSIEYINSLLTHDLPPNAAKLRKVRTSFNRMALWR